jgi:hypothetical protein
MHDARRWTIATAVLLGCLMAGPARAEETTTVIDLRKDQDADAVIENPGKGLYHHYYDNSTTVYPSKREEIDAIPACRQLYIRIPWSVLEPRQGQFDWSRIDDLVRDYQPGGYTFSFRISCKETGYVYATPEWVRLAGAKGGFFKADPNWGENAWEPVWDDPVFLKHLETFLNELGRRYDGKPWLEYVDIGSIGDWGEGHTHFGSRKPVPLEVRRKHIDLHRAALPKTPLALIDDFCAYQTGDAEATGLFEYARSKDCWLRDDSLGVDWWLNQGAAKTWSVAKPAWFAATWPKAPTVIELEHYHMMKNARNWRGQDGSERGADWLLKAMDLCRPTWLGYHGWAAEWLKDNPKLTRELANRTGYWLFPEEVALPQQAKPGGAVALRLRVQNRGWAPPYRSWTAKVCLSNGATKRELTVAGLDARQCQPGVATELSGNVILPDDLAAGDCSVAVRFTDADRAIRFACKPTRQDKDGWLSLGTVKVSR